jgi:hypothetical protein
MCHSIQHQYHYVLRDEFGREGCKCNFVDTMNDMHRCEYWKELQKRIHDGIRKTAQEKAGNTWLKAQCYGDSKKELIVLKKRGMCLNCTNAWWGEMRREEIKKAEEENSSNAEKR